MAIWGLGDFHDVLVMLNAVGGVSSCALQPSTFFQKSILELLFTFIMNLILPLFKYFSFKL